MAASNDAAAAGSRTKDTSLRCRQLPLIDLRPQLCGANQAAVDLTYDCLKRLRRVNAEALADPGLVGRGSCLDLLPCRLGHVHEAASAGRQASLVLLRWWRVQIDKPQHDACAFRRACQVDRAAALSFNASTTTE